MNDNKGKRPEDELSKAILARMNDKYQMADDPPPPPPDKIKRLPPEVKTPDQVKEYLKKKFEAEQKKAAEDAAAKAAASDAAWKRKEAADKQAELQRAAKAKAAEEEAKKSPNYIDSKGFDKAGDPNPIEEANRNRTLPGKDQGANR